MIKKGIVVQDNTEKNTKCIRCGECCVDSSPTLQASDIPLVDNGFIGKSSLYTIRKGELVRDPIEKRLIRTERELIKIKGKSNGRGCIYYEEEENSCLIYDNRPEQCRAFACGDTSEFFRIYGEPKASRAEIFRDNILLELLDQHDEKCGYYNLEKIVKQIKSSGEKAVHNVLEILKFDYDLRSVMNERLGIDNEEMELFLGRPLTETIIMFGLKVVKEADESFLLTVAEPSSDAPA
ncbi:YkgJ family cysteine cluster protein [Thermodesulfobacteriota bacterium]